jgi:hypothetical protein
MKGTKELREIHRDGVRITTGFGAQLLAINRVMVLG